MQTTCWKSKQFLTLTQHTRHLVADAVTASVSITAPIVSATTVTVTIGSSSACDQGRGLVRTETLGTVLWGLTVWQALNQTPSLLTQQV